MIRRLLRVVGSTCLSVGRAIVGMVRRAFGWVSGQSGLAQRVATVGKAVVETVQTVVEGVFEFAADVAEKVTEVVTEAAEAVKEAAKTVVNTVKAAVRRVATGGWVWKVVEFVGVAAVAGVILWLGLPLPVWWQIPLGWLLGWLGGRYGLGAMLLVPCLWFYSLVPLCLSAFLVSLMAPHEGFEGERSGMNLRSLLLSFPLAALFVLLGQLVHKNLGLTTLAYAVMMLFSVLRAGERAPEAFGILAGLLAAMAVCHAFNIPILALFATHYLCRFLFNQERAEVNDPELATNSTLLASVIPGVNANFFTRLIYGHRSYNKHANDLEASLEWGAALSFLFVGIADGKTLVGNYITGADPTAAGVAIGATFLLSLVTLGRQSSETPAPSPSPSRSPKPSPRIKLGLQLAACLIAAAAINPYSILVPLLLAPAFTWLYKERLVDAQAWSVPAYVTAAGI